LALRFTNQTNEYELPDNYERGRFFLLAIGIDKYDNFDDTPGAAKDAREVTKLLSQKYGFTEIQEVESNLATASGIKSALMAYIDDDPEDENNTDKQKAKITLEETDNLLIWFSGHGDRNKKNIDLTYFIPKNGDLDTAENPQSNWIGHKDFKGLIEKIKARKILLISDSCFSGGILDFRDGAATANINIRKNLTRKSRQAITSCKREPTLDTGMNGHSYFTHALLEVLRENHGVITAYMLTTRIKMKLARFDEVPTPDKGNLVAGIDGEFLFFNSESNQSDVAYYTTGSKNAYREFQKNKFRSFTKTVFGKHFGWLVAITVFIFASAYFILNKDDMNTTAQNSIPEKNAIENTQVLPALGVELEERDLEFERKWRFRLKNELRSEFEEVSESLFRKERYAIVFDSRERKYILMIARDFKNVPKEKNTSVSDRYQLEDDYSSNFLLNLKQGDFFHIPTMGLEKDLFVEVQDIAVLELSDRALYKYTLERQFNSAQNQTSDSEIFIVEFESPIPPENGSDDPPSGILKGHTTKIEPYAIRSEISGKYLISYQPTDEVWIEQDRRIWDLETLSELSELYCSIDCKTYMKFSPKGNYVYLGRGELWDIKKSRKVDFPDNFYYSSETVWSPDEKYIFTPVDRDVGNIFDLEIGSIVFETELGQEGYKFNKGWSKLILFDEDKITQLKIPEFEVIENPVHDQFNIQADFYIKSLKENHEFDDSGHYTGTTIVLLKNLIDTENKRDQENILGVIARFVSTDKRYLLYFKEYGGDKVISSSGSEYRMIGFVVDLKNGEKIDPSSIKVLGSSVPLLNLRDATYDEGILGMNNDFSGAYNNSLGTTNCRHTIEIQIGNDDFVQFRTEIHPNIGRQFYHRYGSDGTKLDYEFMDTGEIQVFKTPPSKIKQSMCDI